jgi:ribosomal protein S18 acetylase RimI-like enzyme
MLQIRNSSGPDLPALAICQMQCFSNSFATKLGQAYVAKTLEWFLVQEQRFLYHVTDGEKIVGYCGGFVPRGYGDGSSSGMLQHAFKEAVVGVLKKPWLLFHAELRPLYPLIFRNIKARIFKTKPKPTQEQLAVYKKRAGLVVIGVLPESRGTGVIKLLMEEFDRKAIGLHTYDTALSVKKENLRAIGAYQKFGWEIIEEHPITYVLGKTIPH